LNPLGCLGIEYSEILECYGTTTDQHINIICISIGAQN